MDQDEVALGDRPAGPQVWRRYLVLLLDSMITARDEPTAQTTPPLTRDGLHQMVNGRLRDGS